VKVEQRFTGVLGSSLQGALHWRLHLSLKRWPPVEMMGGQFFSEG
jgi:hypothetical protein